MSQRCVITSFQISFLIIVAQPPTNNGAIKECNRWCVYDYIELVETDKDFDSVGKNAI